MALLAGINYDPAVSVSKSTASLLAMTALDTTNLRLTFTAPATSVLVRLRGTVHGATTFPQILLGVLDGATIRGRQTPIGALKTTAVATAQLTQEAMFIVSGLTAGQSYTWDAAYGVETLLASTGLKYGGPNDTTGNDAFGGFIFEVYDCPTLIASALYDPGTAVTILTTALAAMTAFDTSNLRFPFTAPGTGKVLVRMVATVEAGVTMPTILLGVLDGATIRGRQSPIGGLPGTALATTKIAQEASFTVSVVPGQNYTWDAAYAIQVLQASGAIRYGGPNDAVANNAFGGLALEIYQV